MELSGETEIEAARSTVWGAIADPERMARLMPGVSELEILDDSHWNATVKFPVGLGSLKMKLECERAENRSLEYAVLRAKGRGVGATMSMTTSFSLSGDGPRTSLQWQAVVEIGGRVGQMGQRVLEPIVTQQIEGVLQALRTATVGPEVGTAPPATPSGPRSWLRDLMAIPSRVFRRVRGRHEG